jgi:hypothetical protein
MSELNTGLAETAMAVLMRLPLTKRVDAANDLTIHLHPTGRGQWWGSVTCPGEHQEQTLWLSLDIDNREHAFDLACYYYDTINHKLRMP